MKTFSVKRSPDLTPREAAQGCLTANLAVPGLGSIIVGRKVGFVQIIMYFSGFALTSIFGVRFIFGALSNWSAFYAEFYGPDADVVSAMSDLWHRTRWAFLGIALCAVAWIWAFATSRALLAAANNIKNAPKSATV